MAAGAGPTCMVRIAGANKQARFKRRLEVNVSQTSEGNNKSGRVSAGRRSSEQKKHVAGDIREAKRGWKSGRRGCVCATTLFVGRSRDQFNKTGTLTDKVNAGPLPINKLGSLNSVFHF